MREEGRAREESRACEEGRPREKSPREKSGGKEVTAFGCFHPRRAGSPARRFFYSSIRAGPQRAGVRKRAQIPARRKAFFRLVEHRLGRGRAHARDAEAAHRD